MITTHTKNVTSAHYSRIGAQECEKIHLATLEILERVGVEVHDEKAKEILVANGATADGLRVRIPAHMVTKALQTAPKQMTLFDRKGKVAMRAGGFNSYFGNGSDCLNILDHRTGKRRKPVLEDVVQAIRLLDALPEIDFVMSAFLPADVSGLIYDRYQMEVMLNNTTKPIVFVTPDFEGCAAEVEMCEAVAGSAEDFQRKPFAVCYINVTSGLVANEDSLQKCMYLAEKGLPQLYIPLSAGSINAPTTMAGCIANQNAGVMLGIVLSQLVREGSPVAITGWAGGSWNLKTMIGNYVLADEQGLAASMGRYYDLPVFGVGGATDAKTLDQQCGFETTLTMMTALLNGANIIHDIGFMNQGLLGSMQMMAIANETLGFLRAATRGIEVNDDTLALDVIEELGPTGDYLTHEHTLKHFREFYYPTILDKNSYTVWEDQGAKSLETRAADLVDKILAKHQPEPLPEDVQQAIKKIVAREQARVDNQT